MQGVWKHEFRGLISRGSSKTRMFGVSSISITNAFTVDVEDYFQVSAFESRVSRKHWDKYESRVELNTNRLLSLLDEVGVRGTFFVLGWVADRYPSLIKRIQADGHEIASHGYWHQLIYNQCTEGFSQDVRQSIDAIANACGVRVTAYRAPSFSIVTRSLWALDVLIELGFKSDSSIFPIVGHDRYGIPGAKKEIHNLRREHGTIQEFPPSAWHIGRANIPIGGGYFRILPLPVTLKAISMVNNEGRPAMFYIHPWEIDPAQPRVTGSSLKTKVRHYTGLARCETRLKKLLTRFRFTTMSECVASAT
jgi:polysaccharide deacetylase family protein (PEP-CTERM system associated)